MLRSQSVEVRNLWAQRPQVCILDGLLIRYFEEKNLIQLIIPSTIRWKLVAHTTAHSRLTSGQLELPYSLNRLTAGQG